MKTDDFLKLAPEEKADLINKMLKEGESNHLQNVAKKIGMNPSTFSKVMRSNGNYQYNQSQKQYYKLMAIDDYQKLTKNQQQENHETTLNFINEHIDDLRQLLSIATTQLVIDPSIYDTKAKTVTKTIQVNAEVYEQFQSLVATKFPHLRMRELFSKCLLDFTEKYDN